MYVYNIMPDMCMLYQTSSVGYCVVIGNYVGLIAGADLGGVAGVATPPNDFEQPLPLIYKAYYSLAQ